MFDQLSRLLTSLWDLMCPPPNLFGLALWRVKQQRLGLAIHHGDFEHYIATNFLVAVLDVGLKFALQAITINGLWFGRMWIATVRNGASVYVSSFCRHIVEAMMASKFPSQRLDIVLLVLSQIVSPRAQRQL